MNHNKIRPGWFQDGQPKGMERFHNGTYWEGEPRPIQVVDDTLKHRGWWTAAGIAFIAVFAVVNLSAAEFIVFGTILLLLSPFMLIAVVLWLLWRVGNNRTTVNVTAPSAMIVGTVPAGWYPDMNDSTLQRWWSGTEWTSATLPRQP